VQSGDTVVLGGLIFDFTTKQRQGLPLLSRLPGVGALFGATENDGERTELVMLISPRVVRNRLEGLARAARVAFDRLDIHVICVPSLRLDLAQDRVRLRDTIEALLSGHGLGGRFPCIIGYAEVGMARQKPAPDGLLAALEELTDLAPGLALYVGDHETDMRCAESANRELAARRCELRVRSVAALWGDGASDRDWTVQPDFRAPTPADVIELVAGLTGT